MKRPEFIARLARHPSGLLGRLLARLMAAETAPENEFGLRLLDLQADDAFLEIGFGHGKSLGKAATIVQRGFLAGVDLSPDMLRMAARNNRDFLAKGNMELKQADSAGIPYEDQRFTKLFSVNTIYFWSDPNADFREIFRVLKNGARFVLGFHLRDDRVLAEFPPSIYRFYSLDEVEAYLRKAGFDRLRFEKFPDPTRNFYFAVAHRPA